LAALAAGVAMPANRASTRCSLVELPATAAVEFAWRLIGKLPYEVTPSSCGDALLVHKLNGA
jgi:hypothetical protein